ncbi:MAG: hypothetical protein P1U68_08135 [Verrucomicrobiales bacterium]|nr:hypothetical protein [Verrucomicrobiales bacterium]
MRVVVSLFLVALLSGCGRPDPVQVVIETEPSVDALVSTVLNGGGTFKDVDFSTLIETSTGNRVLPLNPEEPVDAAIIDGIDRAVAEVVASLNEPGSPTHEEGRINEVSSHFEDGLLEVIDRDPEFACGNPRTAEGNLQRSGYPDLEIRHLESGRVIYLDPKLVAEGSLNSSLRTFYFTPRTETNKVLEDAHHLLVGIEHDGNTGKWKYLRWHLVDLTTFKVTLKAEFQASNRDLYQPGLIIREGAAD